VDVPVSLFAAARDVYQREGIELDVSTLADRVGAAAARSWSPINHGL
jgi:hypothetical protein